MRIERRDGSTDRIRVRWTASDSHALDSLEVPREETGWLAFPRGVGAVTLSAVGSDALSFDLWWASEPGDFVGPRLVSSGSGVRPAIIETVLLTLMHGDVIQAAGAWPNQASTLDVTPSPGAVRADLCLQDEQVGPGAATWGVAPWLYALNGDVVVKGIQTGAIGSTNRLYVSLGGPTGGSLGGFTQGGYLTHRWDTWATMRLTIGYGGIAFPYAVNALGGAGNWGMRILLREFWA